MPRKVSIASALIPIFFRNVRMWTSIVHSKTSISSPNAVWRQLAFRIALPHRKHAVRLLSEPILATTSKAIFVGRKIYHDAVKDVLVTLWE